MSERAQYISQFNAFYLPGATISESPTKCENLRLFQEEEVGLKKKNEKKMEDQFRKQLAKEIKEYPAKFKNVIVEFQLDREIWYQANAEIYPTPTGGYLIYGILVMKNRNTMSQEDAQLNEIAKTLNLDAAGQSEEVPNLIEEHVHDEKRNHNNTNESLDPMSNDVEIVMQQANCTREQAISALKLNNNDLINAIMQLSS
jgi:nascent polypeptide-associated complex subunit alpha